ncbi:hypothetical protein EUGRSUZ_F01778 [Eucalyptus grandis]|uniref:Uncharacterized protein n=2 Tax=Eucalyptus grandis TaxID=71139 RepID=A0ACC3KFM7_EUCGR|nr:hypothetical protein EUGRSUZ_F01778 [Eucalyptus grandis]
MVFASTLGCSFEAGWGWNCTQYSLEQTIDMGSQRRHQNWEGSVGGIQIHSQSPTSILLATVHPCRNGLSAKISPRTFNVNRL